MPLFRKRILNIKREEVFYLGGGDGKGEKEEESEETDRNSMDERGNKEEKGEWSGNVRSF